MKLLSMCSLEVILAIVHIRLIALLCCVLKVSVRYYPGISSESGHQFPFLRPMKDNRQNQKTILVNVNNLLNFS